MKKIMILGLLMISLALMGTDWEVKLDGTGDFIDIQNAIDATTVVNGDRIIVYPGTYSPFEIDNKSLEIYSRYYITNDEATIDNTIIDADFDGDCIRILHSTEVTIDGFSIINGQENSVQSELGHGVKIAGSSKIQINACKISNNSVTGRGAGIFVTNGAWLVNEYATTISMCHIENNQASIQGGGIYIDCAQVEIIDCIINSNIAAFDGGGIHILHKVLTISNQCNIENCQIINNSSYKAGGIGVHEISGNVIINNNIISNNLVENSPGYLESSGGGIRCHGNCQIIGNTIKDNSSEYAGGGGTIAGNCNIDYTVDYPILFKDNLVQGNTANIGGGLLISNGIVNTFNNTIVENEATVSGGGIYFNNLTSDPNMTTKSSIINNILWYNQVLNNPNQIYFDQNDGIKISIAYSDIQNISNETYLSAYNDNIQIEPRFNDPANDVYTLLTDSPCIDAGDPDPTYFSLDDEDTDGTRKDIGCYFLNQNSLPIEQRTLGTGWNWICFPRLKRVDEVNGSTNIPTYGTGKFLGSLWDDTVTGADPISITDNYSSNLNWVFAWSQPNYIIESLEGFKLVMSGIGTESQVGALESPDTEIVLTNLNTRTWQIGYFLAEPGLITEVIPQALQNNEFLIQAKDWCATYNPSGLSGSPWKFDTTSEPVIKCGQMVVIKILGRTTYNFQWQEPQTTRVEYIGRPMPEYFSFIEQEDYLPLFLELDPINLPQEIGIFIDGECKGAAVVNQNQTEEAICQINGYLLEEAEDNWQENLEIVYYYDARSANKTYSKFAVYNEQNSEFYIQDLILADMLGKDQITISMRDGDFEEAPETEFDFRSYNYPNPFNPSSAGRSPTTTIYFSLSTTADTSLEIYNVKGQKVKTLVNGTMEQGEHQITWDGTNNNRNSVSSGVYFYRLQSGENVINQKMMLMK